MKIQQTPNLQLNSKNQTTQGSQDTSFKGGEIIAQALNALDSNQTLGAIVVDVCFMDSPRTVVDFSRGPEAGLETMRREFTSTVNNTLIGVYGLGAAYLLSRRLNNKFNIKANKVFASDESLNILAQIRDKHGDISTSDKNLNNFLEEIFNNTKAFNPDAVEKSQKALANGWVSIDAATQKDIVKKFSQELKGGSNKLSKESKAYLKSVIANSTGSEKNFKLEHGKSVSHSSLEDLIDNVYKISKTFMNSEVAQTFKNTKLADNTFVNGMKKLNKGTAAMGLAIAATIGLCVQPFNAYLTKKKTGKSGFVGVEGREPDNSNSFKMLKYAISAVGAVAILKSIGKIKPNEILRKVQFKGSLPTIDQFKLVYGATLISRVLSARDKNELRETTIKDTLGFAHWLILGGFVSKLAAAGFGKMEKFKNDKFIRYNEQEHGKGWFNWLTKSSIVSREEVLHSAFKKTTKMVNGKEVAMTFKEMLKKAPQSARTKVRYLGLIQLTGYLYSGLALGIGIPKLNIAITKHFQKKQKETEAKK